MRNLKTPTVGQHFLSKSSYREYKVIEVKEFPRKNVIVFVRIDDKALKFKYEHAQTAFLKYYMVI